jgi:DNA-binding GntR family transcriptional regulator
MSSLAQKAYQAVKNDIITCTIEPGQTIVQSQLVEWYDMGTTPIREALQRLAQEKLVTPIPRVGYVVDPIAFSDVREIFELRYVLESAAARLVASRADAEDLERIRSEADFTYVYRDQKSYAEFLAHNAAFHLSIAEAAGNSRLVEPISGVLDELTRVFHLGLDVRDSAEEMRLEHIELADALCERNPDRAEEVVQDQIARSQERVLQALIRRQNDLSAVLSGNARVEAMAAWKGA